MITDKNELLKGIQIIASKNENTVVMHSGKCFFFILWLNQKIVRKHKPFCVIIYNT